MSESTVGRILEVLINKGLVIKFLSAPRAKRKRRFVGHAQRWQYDLKAKKPGQMVQIDNMTVSKNCMAVNHFQAWDPKSKFIYANIFSKASSASAAKFLKQLIDAAPFAISSIQVDGGSEFMKDFEQTCQDLGFELFVLPPKRPQYNGGC